MSLYDCIEPYDFECEVGCTDLSDVDLDHPVFRQHFPDGLVPIRRVATLGVQTRDFCEWASELLARFEAAHQYPVDYLELLRSRLHIAAAVATTEHRGAGQLSDCQRLIGLMINQGMTLRAIARYCELPLGDIVLWYMKGSHTYHPSMAEAVADAHELLANTLLSKAEIARRCGISRKTVIRLGAHRPSNVDTGGRTPDEEAA